MRDEEKGDDGKERIGRSCGRVKIIRYIVNLLMYSLLVAVALVHRQALKEVVEGADRGMLKHILMCLLLQKVLLAIQ